MLHDHNYRRKHHHYQNINIITTCEEDEEQPKAVKENELKEQDNAKEPVDDHDKQVYDD